MCRPKISNVVSSVSVVFSSTRAPLRSSRRRQSMATNDMFLIHSPRTGRSGAVITGVMIRVLGGPGDPATRLENRIGEPAANPYLYMASQILCGLDGINRKLDLGPSADTPYDVDAPRLPKSLREAVFALAEDAFLRKAMGETFVRYYTQM